jgi:hypothetical protein
MMYSRKVGSCYHNFLNQLQKRESRKHLRKSGESWLVCYELLESWLVCFEYLCYTN